MMRVIIVEDEGLTRKWIQKKIQDLDMGFLVEGVFSNGSQALKYLEQNDTEVIFTDIQMPVMDGLELLEQIQERENQPYKVILSAYDEFCYARRAMKLGAQEFVLKPEITEESLRHILEEARSFQEQKQREKSGKKEEKNEGPEELLRQLIDETRHQGGEENHREMLGRLETYGISLAWEKLMMADIIFEDSVPQKPVLELLNLFLEEASASDGGAVFAKGVQEFVLLYPEENHDFGRKRTESLWEVLRTHMGVEAYVGVSFGSQNMELPELYHQASMACENRRFFEISGCQSYENLRITADRDAPEFGFFQDLKQVGSYLEQRQYSEAEKAVERILEGIFKASYLYPAYVKTVCNEFLAVYLHEIWQYPLTPEEKARVAKVELLLGSMAGTFRILREHALEAVKDMSLLLKEKTGAEDYSKPVREILQYLEEHYGERISLTQISEAIYLSPSYASTLFKKETGKKFSTYLQELRLEKSCEMLLHTQFSVQEIAVRTGFFDTAHFSHAFKERYGLSPLEYRKTKNITKK